MNYESDKLKKITVLYVEDEETIRVNVGTCLNYIFNIIIAEDGKEGINKFKNNNIDLVITDINMPQKNGITMIEEIKKISPNTPCILTTAYDINAIDGYSELGISSYIQKPFDVKDLLTATINTLNFDKNK